MIEIKFLCPDTCKNWDDYVTKHSQSYVYHLSSWQNIFAEMKLFPLYIYAWDKESNKFVGVLPLVLTTSYIFGRFITSVPFYNYAGILADNDKISQELYNKAALIAKENNAKYVELRHSDAILQNVPQKTNKVRMVLDLPQSSETLWKNFKAKLRSQIKRAQKEQMDVSFGQLDLLDDFYRVFSINMRDLGTPVWPKNLFKRTIELFSDHTQICVIYHQSVPVASGFLLGFKDTLEIPSASSLRKYNAKSPNMLLYWSVLEYACSKGYSRFDFGRCSIDSGTFHFKKQWGALAEQLTWEYWLEDGKLPELNPQNSKYELAIQLWQKFPVFLANFLGPIISRKLP